MKFKKIVKLHLPICNFSSFTILGIGDKQLSLYMYKYKNYVGKLKY